MSKLCSEPILNTYFSQKNILAKHQIESFNDYVDNIIPNIIVALEKYPDQYLILTIFLILWIPVS